MNGPTTKPCPGPRKETHPQRFKGWTCYLASFELVDVPLESRVFSTIVERLSRNPALHERLSEIRGQADLLVRNLH